MFAWKRKKVFEIANSLKIEAFEKEIKLNFLDFSSSLKDLIDDKNKRIFSL